MLFVVLPWELSLAKNFLRYNIVFVIWSVVLSVLMLGCVTVQGSWLSIFRAVDTKEMRSQLSVLNRVGTALLKLQFKEALGNAMAVVAILAKFLIFYTIHMVKHALKTIIGFPEPRALAGNVYLCNKRMLFCLCERRSGEDKDKIHTVTWTAFSSSFTMIFLLPLPVIGPYLWLVTAMLSRSGFWLIPFWMWIVRTVSTKGVEQTDVEMQETKQKEVILYESKVARDAESLDVANNVLKKFYEPLPFSEEKFVDMHNDKGRVLRVLSILAYVLIPLMVLWCVLQNGFNVVNFVFCYVPSMTEYNWNNCLDIQLKDYNVTSCPYR